MKGGMELLLNDLSYLQKVFNSWLATEAPLSLTMKYGIPWIENVYTSQMIDYFRWIYVSQWNCISPFRIAIVNNLNIFPKKGSAKSISESSSRELLFFFPWMYWCFSWHCLVYLARFSRFHSHFNFNDYIWPSHIERVKTFILTIPGWFSWSSIKIFSRNWIRITTLFSHIKQELSNKFCLLIHCRICWFFI